MRASSLTFNILPGLRDKMPQINPQMEWVRQYYADMREHAIIYTGTAQAPTIMLFFLFTDQPYSTVSGSVLSQGSFKKYLRPLE